MATASPRPSPLEFLSHPWLRGSCVPVTSKGREGGGMISISLWASALRPPHGAELLVSLRSDTSPALTPAARWVLSGLASGFSLPGGARQPDESEAHHTLSHHTLGSCMGPFLWVRRLACKQNPRAGVNFRCPLRPGWRFLVSYIEAYRRARGKAFLERFSGH